MASCMLSPTSFAFRLQQRLPIVAVLDIALYTGRCIDGGSERRASREILARRGAGTGLDGPLRACKAVSGVSRPLHYRNHR